MTEPEPAKSAPALDRRRGRYRPERLMMDWPGSPEGLAVVTRLVGL